MLRRIIVACALMSLFCGGASAEEPQGEGGDKLISGMSIVGNDEAPKSLVIVPWKSSELGDALDVSRIVDDGRRPVDRAVFMRELSYYQIVAGSEGASGSITP
jgi:hypothetical protein